MIQKAKAHGIDGLDFEWAPIINKDFVKELKASGMKSLVWVYKEDDKIENIKQCAQAGIDYFTTNDPAKFLVELNKITL
jgi:glycerophosphoryl diester phosphodiesterase